jgi:hypothetical protein
MFTQINNEKIRLNFQSGIKVYVDGPETYYLVEINEFKKNSDSPVFVESYHITTKSGKGKNSYFNLPIEFYFDFEVNVYRFNEDSGLQKIFSHRYNDNGKLLKFVLDTSNFEEAKIWIEQIKKYQLIHNCKIVVESKFDVLDNTFNTKYLTKDIDFYRIYNIGRYPKSSNDWRTVDPRKEGVLWFGYWKTFWSYQHPRCWTSLSSKEIINDILCIE